MTKNSDLRRENAELKSTLVNIRREIAEFKIKFIDLKMENEDLKNKVTKLTNTLAYYDNSNTPPSHKTFTQQTAAKQSRARNKGDGDDGKTVKKPVGGQKGHKGRTNKPKATEFKTCTPKQCPKCKTTSIKIVKTVKETITDIPPSPPPITTEYTIEIAKCNHCNVTIVPKPEHAEHDSIDSKLVDDAVVLTRRQLQSDSNKNKKSKEPVTITPLIVNDKNQVKDEEFCKGMYSQFINTRNQLKPQIDILPNYGNYGKNIQMLMTQHFLNRMPIRMIADNLNERMVQISTGAVCNNLSAIGMYLTRPTGKLLDTIRQASVLHIDETSMSLNGKNIWVWIFFDPETSTVLYVLAASRGRNVIQEVLLPDWKGTIVCDGWGPYKMYFIQRCWAHIIREAKDIAEKHPDDKQAQSMLKYLRNIYERACNVKGSKKKRSHACKLLLRSIERLLAKYADMPLLEKFITKLGNAKNDLFVFVINRNVPSTNNAAERGLREIVIHRKIRGGLRSIQSMVSFGNLLSCAETWKLRGMKYLEEMVKYS